ncbi:uncharacterized protein LOC119723083 [Patiria miniata]|uniref:Uncharacterized protein n=1 Tax=Patiria miniata TaxID=46514 RepID=A0A913ZEX8_PATMI|nr:uncharacterized protein LOC119723083 [Patiria miniata]XP_038049515.1 uncharacterized protein LOC119723083 [Patiria miniata]XP_038049516.1 uncharacterized protein LOC119723083 [Patiria miniata]XP_038049517.1 uncharacterized protein LOC119723083 [Patiria miniata]XP_038049518.1 uncharacterized protein LOC119723083 [Patiria miniata]
MNSEPDIGKMWQFIKALPREPVIRGSSLQPVLICLALLGHAFVTPAVGQSNRVVKKTITIDPTSGTEGFTEEEKYKDIFELTEENFEEWVVEAEDPWIVLFTDGMLKKEWKTLAVSLRGIVWFGMVHRLQQEDLLDEIDFNVRKNPPARVYPYGGGKTAKWTDVQTPREAKEIAVNSLPEVTTELDPQLLNNFLYDSYMMHPSAFPAIFITDKETPPVFKSIALHYKRYFNFGVIRNPDPSYLETLKYDLGIPGFLVLVSDEYVDSYGSEDQDTEYTFQSIGYTVQRQGELNYPNLVKFLYGVNLHYRRTLPGTNMADEEDVLRMEEVMDVEGQRFDVRYMEDLRNIQGLEPDTLAKGIRVRGDARKSRNEL